MGEKTHWLSAIRVPPAASFEIKDLADIKLMVRPNCETTPSP
jgi:hypothetical protein